MLDKAEHRHVGCVGNQLMLGTLFAKKNSHLDILTFNIDSSTSSEST